MSSATSIKPVRRKPDATGKEVGLKSDTTGKEVRLKPDTTGDATVDEHGFRPWHFFVLASLTMATVAVVMSRQATPEHLILISLTIGAAGAAAAGFYRTLAPLVVHDASLSRESLSERARAAVEREKMLVLRSIKELEFDRAMGKLSAKDFDEMSGRLRARALMLMKQVDQGGAGYRDLIERELRARLASRSGHVRPDDPVRLKPDATDEVRLKPDATDEVRLEPDSAEEIRLKPDATGTTCRSCGTSNDSDASFCKRCGTKLGPSR